MNRQDRNIEFPPSQGGAVSIVSKVPGWCGRSSGIVADTQPSGTDEFAAPLTPWLTSWSGADTIKISDPVPEPIPAAVFHPSASGCPKHRPNRPFRGPTGRAGIAGRQLQRRNLAPDCRLLPGPTLYSSVEHLLAIHNL